MLTKSTELRDKLAENTKHWREGITKLGFTVRGEVHPITPIMLGDARLATLMADDLLKEGIYVIGFSYPVVPHGQARIRTQISAGHSRADLDRALEAFAKVGTIARDHSDLSYQRPSVIDPARFGQTIRV
jgi:glycine C-acetyltransferase